MNYWLIKTEPNSYSIDDLKRDGRTEWDGVRNYQARNFLRDGMKLGDLILFYHSNSDPLGVVGVARVCSEPHPDSGAFDPKDHHFDPKSDPEKPTWITVDVEFVKKFSRVVSLDEMKREPVLKDMVVTQRGSRLSVQPVREKEFEKVVELGR